MAKQQRAKRSFVFRKRDDVKKERTEMDKMKGPNIFNRFSRYICMCRFSV